MHAFLTFPLILAYVVYTYPIQETIFLIYGLTVCIVILYQGQRYWKSKLDRFKGKAIDRQPE